MHRYTSTFLKKFGTLLIVAWCQIVFFGTLKGQSCIDSLLASLNERMEETHVPGAIFSIVRGDSVLYIGGLGQADIARNIPVTAQHLFRQGSISKSITALGLLHYMHGSPLHLGTPILEVDPTIPLVNSWEEEAPITIEQLLEHTTGFDDMHLHAVYNRVDSMAPSTQSLVHTHRKSLKARWKPGTRKAYSNPGYVLAGHMLETHTGVPYHQYLQDHILDPLGMERSGFYFQSPDKELMAQGYRYQGPTRGLAVQPFTQIQGGPAGELCANAEEMAHLLQFMLNRGAPGIDSTVFTQAIFDRIENSKTTLAGEAGLVGGYGLGNASAWRNGHVFHGHGGAIDGFSSYYTYSREADLGVAVAINRSGNARDLVEIILAHYLGEHPEPPADRQIMPIPEELAQTYAGFYGMRSPRNQLFAFTETILAGVRLDFESDRIIIRNFINRAKDTLYYAGDNQFYVGNEGIPSAMLIQEDGKPVFWRYETYFSRESHAWRVVANIGILFALIMPFVFLVYGVIWGLGRFVLGAKQDWEKVLLLWGSSACFPIMLTGFSLSLEDFSQAGTFDFNSGLLYVSSLLLALGTGLSVYAANRLKRGKGFRRFYQISVLALVILVIFLGNNGFIGFKLWAY